LISVPQILRGRLSLNTDKVYVAIAKMAETRARCNGMRTGKYPMGAINMINVKKRRLQYATGESKTASSIW